MSWRKARENFSRLGACEERFVDHVVSPRKRKRYEFRPLAQSLSQDGTMMPNTVMPEVGQDDKGKTGQVSRARYVWLAASVAMFAWSLIGPAFYQDSTGSASGEAGLEGWFLLAVGYYGIVFGSIAWFANPALCAAWLLLLLKQPRWAAASAATAVALGLSSLLLQEYSNGNAHHRISHYSAFYWLWIGSAAVVFLGGLVLAATARSPERD
jgi:hypothetical protein